MKKSNSSIHAENTIESRNGTLQGAAIGILSTVAAIRIQEASGRKANPQTIEKKAKVISETLLGAELPESNRAISEYIDAYIDGKIDANCDFAETIASLYSKDAKGLDSKRVQITDKLINDAPFGISPVEYIAAKSDDYISVLEEWDIKERKSKQNFAKLELISYSKLLQEAHDSLVRHNILDEDGNITQDYIENVLGKTSGNYADTARQNSMDSNPRRRRESETDVRQKMNTAPIVANIEENALSEDDQGRTWIDALYDEDTTDNVYSESEYSVEPPLDNTLVINDDDEEEGEIPDIAKYIGNDITVPISAVEAGELDDIAFKSAEDESDEAEALEVPINATVMAEKLVSKVVEKAGEEKPNEFAKQTTGEIPVVITGPSSEEEIEEAIEIVEEAIAAEVEHQRLDDSQLEKIEIVPVEDVMESQNGALDENQAVSFTESFLGGVEDEDDALARAIAEKNKDE